MMTDEQWKQVENALNSLGQAKLKIDGYDITLAATILKNRITYAVFINGEIKTAHAFDDCEERRRFYNKHIHCFYSASKIKNAPKDVQAFLKDSGTFDWYEPYWTSFRRMKAHFIRNNESIEFVETN